MHYCAYMHFHKEKLFMKNRQTAILIISIFLVFYFLPLDSSSVSNAIMEAFHMVQEYAQHHVLFCLIPAFFIAGAIANFISQGTVIKYLGTKTNKKLSYMENSFLFCCYGQHPCVC